MQKLISVLFLMIMLGRYAVGYCQWEMQESGVTSNLGDITFSDSLHGWAVGDSCTILATTDGGRTWHRQVSPVDSVVFEKVIFLNSQVGYLGGNRHSKLPGRVRLEVTLLRTCDAGNNWEIVAIPLGQDYSFYDMFFIDQQIGWLTAGNGGYSSLRERGGVIIHTDNSGNTWSIQLDRKPLFIGDIDFIDENNGWALSSGSIDNFGTADVLRTYNGGENWEILSILDYKGWDMHIISPDTIWVAGPWLAKSENAGRNWQYPFVDSCGTNRNVEATHSDNVWILENTLCSPMSRLLSSADFGETWKLEYEIQNGLFSFFLLQDGSVWATGKKGLIVHRSASITEVKKSQAPGPEKIELEENYPNPFNAWTAIRFSLPKSTGVSLKIYDVRGREISTILSTALPQGKHAIRWDSKMQNGTLAPSGIYFYELRGAGFRKTGKMLLIR